MPALFILLALGTSACMNNGYDGRMLLSDRQRKIAVEHTDLSQLLEALEQIKAFHMENRTGAKLKPPLEKAALEKALSKFPCTVSDELKVLWTWHNGEETERFIWYHRFLSVQDALQEYRKLTLIPIFRWSKNWIPVLEFQGEWYAVECVSGNTLGTPVIHYFIEDEPRPAYINLTVYMRVISEAIRQGALRWDGHWWDDDIQSLSRIHARLNPNIRFPYHVQE